MIMDARRAAWWLSAIFVLLLVAEVFEFVPLDVPVDGLSTAIGNAAFLRVLQLVNVPSLVLLALVALWCWRAQRWRAVGAVASSVVFAHVVKLLVHHPRPEGAFYTAIGSGFPSGHAAFAAVVAALAWMALTEKKPKRWRVYRVVVLALCVLVALSRLYLHVHWFSDVIAGVVLGLACVAWAFVKK